MFQSTHPCGVRLDECCHVVRTAHVSIHAPLRGATLVPLRGLDRQALFQSTHPCGVRLTRDFLFNHFVGVSIHAPLRGATEDPDGDRDRLRRFNPRTPAGCDLCCAVHESRHLMFQSTHPCGVRPLCRDRKKSNCCFNPRTPAGCDGDQG